ncbi:hypothetical protein L218DRAFT_1022795 [Marasmius fiardii PR-910]|nr:hypothetical protein L218DRAFT_1022795 [Marasmius fiardii PR-910]
MIKPTLSISFLALLSFVAPSVNAGNDWKTPCLKGVCQYSLSGNSSGTVKIWGSPDGITDITPAAGWEILNCSPDELSQDIRLVCQGDESPGSGCAHLYQTIGAEGKIVRLPENCGKSAFAHITKAWDSEDQSIPETLARRIIRRGGTPPIVKALHLDTNFTAADKWRQVGPVYFAIQGANFPGADVKGIIESRERRSRIYRRETNELFGINPFKNRIDISKTIDLDPISFTKSANLLDSRISCPPQADAGISADIDSSGSAMVNFGIAATGTIFPPNFDELTIFSGMQSTAQTQFGVALMIFEQGSLDSGRIKIFEAGVPPSFDIPAIFSMGATFSISTQASVQLDVNMNMTVGFNYQVEDAQLVFPPKDQNAGGNFQIGDTPHLIPEINFGISAFGGSAQAQVFLDLDASATLGMSLEASEEQTNANNSTTTTGGCADMTAGFDVDAGARGSFFKIFNEQTQVSLFSKKFPLFKVRTFGVDYTSNS